jgi:tetratricopeptide (TPR) repeat protein
VQKAGNRVRITAQLIRADDGFHVWSQNYDRTLEDIFAIQDEIAADVANALDTSLLGGVNDIHSVDTTNLTAYEAYLKGREQQEINSFASMQRAQSLFKEALATDPEFIDAKLALANNYKQMSWTGIISEAEYLRHSLPLIEQVLVSDPGNYLARALKLQSELGFSEKFDPEERVRKVQELRDLLPLLSDSSYLRELVALQLGFIQNRKQEALEVLEAGLLIDPLAAGLLTRLGLTLRLMERYDEALEALQRALKQQPNDPNKYFDIADVKADLGDLYGALEWRRKGIELDQQDHELTAELAENFFELGLLEEGNHWAAKSIALAPQSAVGRKVRLQQTYARGNKDQALLLAQSMIRDQVSIRQRSLLTALDIHSELMSANGREQEAYDFLLSVRPELEDFATFPGDWKGLQMQRRMVRLMVAFKSPEEAQQAWLDHSNTMDRAFPRWRTFIENQLVDNIMQGRTDEAERLAIDVYLSQPIASDLRRVEDLQLPEYRAINQRPELIARMAEVQLEKTRLRDGVSEMMQKPEWQQ